MRVKLMSGKATMSIVIFGFLLFIGLGDLFPKPISTASRTTRESINRALTGIFPNDRFDNPNRRTEKAVDNLEKDQNQR